MSLTIEKLRKAMALLNDEEVSGTIQIFFCPICLNFRSTSIEEVMKHTEAHVRK